MHCHIFTENLNKFYDNTKKIPMLNSLSYKNIARVAKSCPESWSVVKVLRCFHQLGPLGPLESKLPVPATFPASPVFFLLVFYHCLGRALIFFLYSSRVSLTWSSLEDHGLVKDLYSLFCLMLVFFLWKVF